MKLLFIVILIMTTGIGYTQVIYTGNITDEQNQPIVGAGLVCVTNPASWAITDENGNFEILLKKEGKVAISHTGYKTITIELNLTFNKIRLEENSQLLNEIVVSASREQQKRSEVPAAISTINAQTIEDTKAFGIDQLV